MTAVVSAVVLLGLFLVAWTALYVVSLPVLVFAVRSRAHAGARRSRGRGRGAWAARRR